MIVVVEGISASGKSSWCANHAPGQVIPENGRLEGAPDARVEPERAASFWAERNVARWQAALALEQETALAVCDTDPLKLHYTWSLWKIGGAREREWQFALAATRRTIAESHIGFADRYFVTSVEPELARNRAAADKTRRRRNFELHVRLQPPLLAWYAALGTVLPGRVHFGFPSALPTDPVPGPRYDLAAFDTMIDALQRWSVPTVE